MAAGDGSSDAENGVKLAAADRVPRRRAGTVREAGGLR